MMERPKVDLLMIQNIRIVAVVSWLGLVFKMDVLNLVCVTHDDFRTLESLQRSTSTLTN